MAEIQKAKQPAISKNAAAVKAKKLRITSWTGEVEPRYVEHPQGFARSPRTTQSGPAPPVHSVSHESTKETR